jgi:signal transduction histidine kinase
LEVNHLSSRKLDWNVKLSILFAAVLIATLLVQVFYVIPYIGDREIQNTKTQQEDVAHSIARELDIGLNRLVNSLKLIAERAEFRNMDIDNQTEVLFLYRNTSSEIQSLFVMNETGWFVSGTSENMSIYYTKSYAYKDYFIASFELGEIHFNLPRSYINNTIISASVSVPIESDTGTRIGVLLGTMWLNDLIQNVANYPLEEGELAYLVDTEGTVIAHSEIDVFALEEGPLSLNYSTDYPVQQIMAGETNFTHQYDVNGTAFLGTGVKLGFNNWGMIVVAPMSKIMAQTSALAMNLWLINVGLFGVALGVTVLIAKQITGELRKAQEKLLRQERLATLGQLGAGIGHELRNPLGAIKNAAYFLQMVFEKPAPEVKETIDIIAKEVATSERIISSLLSYARPKPATRRKVNINDVIVEALSASSLPETVEVVSQLDEMIPTMLADPDQLRQVFVNLILNALQAMPKGGRLIVKSWSPRPDSVNVSVADTGVGIPQADLDKIFKPLFTTKAKGIGLGLAIVKTLVDGHDGTIDVQSEPDKGTTFTVRIPVVLREAE